MEINYIRSSSMSQWQYCQQSYYINYVLGHQQVANKKADKGTICHAVMEWLAHMKLNHQNGNGYYHKDERFGEFICSEKEWLKPTKLTDRAIDEINYSRRDKKVFIYTKPVKYGHVRYGSKFIKECIIRAYEYYSKRTSHEWVEQDFMDVSNFVWLILDYHNGEYDPRKLNILYPERQFDIEIKRDWAKLPNGEYLRIKGTIDLTTINNGVIEIIDWKTGKRINWGTGQEKTYEKLCTDPQLMLYYYAVKHLYSEYNEIMITIFFARDGGSFTIPFDDDALKLTEQNLRKTFEEIRDCKKPELLDWNQKDFRCRLLCDYYKNKVGNMNFCHKIANDIKVYGIDECTRKNTKEGFNIGNYAAPGE